MHTNEHTERFVSLCSHTYPLFNPVMLWLQPHRKESSESIPGNISLDPANQGLSRSQSSQSKLSSYYGLEAGGVSLWSKSISVPLCCCFYFSLSPFLFMKKRWWMTPFISHLSVSIFPLLILALLLIVLVDWGSIFYLWFMKLNHYVKLMSCFSEMLKLISIKICIQFVFSL